MTLRQIKTIEPKEAKRIFDIVVSLVLIFICFPLLLIIGFLVKIKLGSPIIFKQRRPGLKGKPFTIYKFRSLTEERDEKGNLLPDYDRFNNFSRILRASSLDELPELFNVFKGDMSLVGPRPLLMEYLNRYDDYQARRHEVRPGITGWAQVNGRNAISWQVKFELDVWYIDNYSFRLDLKIIYLTIFQLFYREGINQEGCVTAQEFKGQHENNK